MPFLTRDLPPGGRHVDRTVPPVVPLAPAAARLRQLLPVGLLVAASSAGVALSPMLGGGSSAVADADHETSSVPGTIPSADYAPGGSTHLKRAAYVVSRDVGRHVGKHRAPATSEGTVAAVISTFAGGKHRASGTAIETAPATAHSATAHSATVQPAAAHAVTEQPAPKHSAATPAPATPTATTTVAESAATVSSPSATPTASSTAQPDLLTATVTGVLGTVTTVLGAN